MRVCLVEVTKNAAEVTNATVLWLVKMVNGWPGTTCAVFSTNFANADAYLMHGAAVLFYLPLFSERALC